MSHSSMPTPAQIRAARALAGLSQDDLAAAAKISAGTLRALEALRRPSDGDAARAVQRELENAGIAFIASDAYGGPGVRLAPQHRPTLVRLPTVVTKWEGVPFEIEWQGEILTAFASRELLEDLDDISGAASDEVLLASFERHRARILDAAALVVVDSSNFDKQGRLYIRSKDVFHLSTRSMPVGKLVKLDPLPKRIWQGVPQSPQDHLWRVEKYEPEKGLVAISNISTGHFLPLYSAHIADVAPEAAGPNSAEFTLHLTVQVVFEDGHARLERL